MNNINNGDLEMTTQMILAFFAAICFIWLCIVIDAIVRKHRHSHISGAYELSSHFGLTRAAWLVSPRVLMQQMPDEWQGDMARLLRQLDATFPEQPPLDYVVRAKDIKTGRFVELPEALCNYRRPKYEQISKMRGQNIDRSA